MELTRRSFSQTGVRVGGGGGRTSSSGAIDGFFDFPFLFPEGKRWSRGKWPARL